MPSVVQRAHRFRDGQRDQLYVGPSTCLVPAEYTEVVERAVALVAELERESARGRFAFAEAELAKLGRWLTAVGGRDRFGAAGRGRAEALVEEAGGRLREFTERTASAEDGAS